MTRPSPWPDLEGLRIREAARALLLTPDHEVLLARFEFPDAGERWALPGGGIEPGETHIDALHRELREETGLVDAAIGPHVWTRVHVIPFLDGLHDGQREHVYLVPTSRFEPQPTIGWPRLRSEYVTDLRWWHLDHLADGLPFVPSALAALVRSIAVDGPPATPFETGA